MIFLLHEKHLCFLQLLIITKAHAGFVIDLNHSTFFEKSQKLQNHRNRICLLRHFGNVGDWNLIHDLHVDWNDNFREFLALGCGGWQNYLWSVVFAAVNDRASRLDEWLSKGLKSFSSLWNRCRRFIFRDLDDVVLLKDRRNWWDNRIARFTVYDCSNKSQKVIEVEQDLTDLDHAVLQRPDFQLSFPAARRRVASMASSR